MYSDTHYLTSANDRTGFPPDVGVEVAFAGRSNAGKSSAINAITGRKGLARTSKTPGRTQLVNFFALDDQRRLVDLPGYGFARVPASVRRHWRVLMTDYFEGRQALAGLVLMMDIRRGVTDFDRQMLHWSAACGCPAHILLTKADKLSRGAANNTLHKVRREIGDVATIQLFSALKGIGIGEAREALDALLAREPARFEDEIGQ